LTDLPVERPQTSYDPLDRGSSLLEGKKPWLKNEDTFIFNFFLLTRQHVQLINSLFLEEAYKTQAIVFRTRSAFLRAVEAYLRLDMPGLKVIERLSQKRGVVISAGPFGLNVSQGSPVDQREGYLKLLETVAHDHGNSTKVKYHLRDAEVVEILPPLPQKFLELYLALGTFSLIYTAG
jgi:hypothetical protein